MEEPGEGGWDPVRDGCFEEAKEAGWDWTPYDVHQVGRLVPAHHLGDAGAGDLSVIKHQRGTRRKAGCYGPDEARFP